MTPDRFDELSRKVQAGEARAHEWHDLAEEIYRRDEEARRLASGLTLACKHPGEPVFTPNPFNPSRVLLVTDSVTLTFRRWGTRYVTAAEYAAFRQGKRARDKARARRRYRQAHRCRR